MNDQSDQRVGKVAAWAGVSGIMAMQGAAVRGLGGEAAAGFQTGLMGFMRSSARSAFMAAPPTIKAATGVAIGAGLMAKAPLQGVSNAIGLARSKIAY